MMLLETRYFPSISWCAAVWPEQKAGLDAAEHYQKGGMRNRCHIAGPNGLQRLSIPLEKGKHQQTPIRDVRISTAEPWQRQHWRSIRTAYGNAPYFEHYADEVARFFERPFIFLFDLNLEITDWVMRKKWGWPGEWVLQNTYIQQGEWREGQDLRNGAFTAGFRPYPQVFEERHGFLPDLSVLDLLFCCGKTGTEVLANTAIFPN